ncbi:MAG: uroporphyrinogen-III synthase [Acidobacteriota bacterium]
MPDLRSPNGTRLDIALKCRPCVVLTRDKEGCRRWAQRIRHLGGDPIALPCLEVRTETSPEVASRLTAALQRAGWLALTSARGVDAVADLLGSASLPSTVRVAAVGPATAARCGERFGRVDLVSELGTGRDLAKRLWQATKEVSESPVPREIVYATADRGRRELEQLLEARGLVVQRLNVYRTIPAPRAESRESLAAALNRQSRPGGRPAEQPVDAVTLASPSAYEGLCNQVELPPDLPLVTIGSTTSAAVRSAGGTVAAEARKPTLEALYAAVLFAARLQPFCMTILNPPR